jgi:hypothetical protein
MTEPDQPGAFTFFTTSPDGESIDLSAEEAWGFITRMAGATHGVGSDLRPTWHEQWDRMIRRHARVEKMFDAGPDADFDDLQDEMDAFFVACNHLYDWLKNGRPVPSITGKVLHDYVINNDALKICRDYVNTHKHMVRDNPPDYASFLRYERQGANSPQVVIAHWSGHGVPDESAIQTVDARQLMTECIAAWTQFLTTRGLEFINN